MNSRKVEILLVEDNPDDVELTLRTLRKRNLTNKIYVVSDGAEALEFIFATGAYAEREIKNKPRMILLDLELPKVNGIEVLGKIKSDERTKNIPVVVLTSSQEEQDMVKSYKLGVNSYIVKPVDFDKFSQVVSELGFYWVLLNKTPYSK
ncbi:response regulator [Patescibacteria group bacterium]|nr:response regulator [Patescibacteria group bacterium]